jgi:hypothetical protein
MTNQTELQTKAAELDARRGCTCKPCACKNCNC